MRATEVPQTVAHGEKLMHCTTTCMGVMRCQGTLYNNRGHFANGSVCLRPVMNPEVDKSALWETMWHEILTSGKHPRGSDVLVNCCCESGVSTTIFKNAKHGFPRAPCGHAPGRWIICTSR